MNTTDALNVETYQGRDGYFGPPYIDQDEWMEKPIPHRRVHGGFADTDTRFTCYFPTEDVYHGRLIQPMEGAHAGHEDAFGGPMGQLLGGLELTARLGGYMVESNAGHIGDDVDHRAGDDPTLYGHRSHAEAAHVSKHLAEQVYGRRPHHAYVWGGSGGGRRSPLCLENAPDVYDGALPFMGGGEIAEHGTTALMKGAQVMAFASMFNVQRLLRREMGSVIDAMRPGGSGDPYAGLDTHQREELANLYRLGYPRGDEFMIFSPMGQIWLWSSIADRLAEQDSDYFTAFWNRPGYVGHDQPDAVAADLIDTRATVTRIVTPRILLEDSAYAGPEFAGMRVMAGLTAAGPDFPIAIEVEGAGSGYRLGVGITILTGEATGRQLYCTGHVGGLLQGDGVAEANLQRFTGVRVGDEVALDNRKFLAFCYYYRHHLMDDSSFDFLRLDGVPIYPQHTVPTMSPLMGVAYSGQYEGKLLWVHHTHDASLWPPQGTIYETAVRRAQGAEGAATKFRLRWTENAEHVPPQYAPSAPDRATTTWLIDYLPVIEQSLVDLIAWVENGVEPVGTRYGYHDGKVSLPTAAAERGGIQPVVAVTANGAIRAEIAAGDAVRLTATVEVPPNAGTLVALDWDFEGTGEFPLHHDLEPGQTAAEVTTVHTYPRPGTYYATARVASHRNGDTSDPYRRIPNLASARIVVR
ncbi:tannase/feruloyl esterase family alpha/beta hydrolase [Cryptosporangium aurantiacum]|uniref:PKD domain-containing protein n=1 Tax=Cryptosporangium aurantiacum TaxID=134849 RepID=A0A1M7PP80_9ACTN|nr:tannase/feruloyl esterase family alpha/beta hydrolase [Cryptosporangium aurantiacum]SHN19054.1 PKD domain-containing protein [Cryptosporangium aurantiacum]